MFIAGFPKLTFSVLVDDKGDRGPPTGTKGKKVSKATKTKTKTKTKDH